MNRLILAVLLVALVFAAGCTAPIRSGVYSVASTSIGPEELGGQFVLVQKGAMASASTPIILFPVGFPRDSELMEQVLSDHGGDLLTNVTLTSKVSVFIAFGSYKLDVVCDVWRRATAEEMGRLDSDELKTLDEIGELAYPRMTQAGSVVEGRGR